MATSSTCWQRNQSASPNTEPVVVACSRTSWARRPGSVSCGTRTHATNAVLLMSIAHTRSTSSSSSPMSSTPTTSPRSDHNGGCPQERYGEKTRRTRVLEATMQGP